MGIELMVSFWPTVDNRTESYREMKENGWLVHTERGLPINMDFLGNTTFFDATHRRTGICLEQSQTQLLR